MKALLLALFFTSGIRADTTNVAVNTNFVTPHWWYRTVNGQLYNIERSKLWEAFDHLELVRNVGTNGLLMREYEEIPQYEYRESPRPFLRGSLSRIGGFSGFGGAIPSASKELVSVKKEYRGLCLFTNVTRAGNIYRALPIGEITIGGEKVRLFDVGVVIPQIVITTNRTIVRTKK